MRGAFFIGTTPAGVSRLSSCLPLTRELSPQATEGENLQSVCSAARRECGVGIVPRLRARRTASTFHRRKVDRKAAGGPLYPLRCRRRMPASDFRQFTCRKSIESEGAPAKPVLRGGRNAPRSPPFALSEDGFCCTPAPRLPRGWASPSGDEGRERPYTLSPTVPSLVPCLHRRTAPSRASGPSSWRPMGNWVSCRRSSS